jgi:hypothetical protein
MTELELYLGKTNAEQFRKWLDAYCKKMRTRNKVYPYINEWTFNLSYPSLGVQSSVDFDAQIYRHVLKNGESGFTEFMPHDIAALRLEWFELGEHLKVVISHYDGLWALLPTMELLSEIVKDWEGIGLKVLDYIKVQAKKFDLEVELPELQTAKVDQVSVKKGKSGRRHFPEDEWAHEQVNFSTRPKDEVYEEWLEKAKANPKRKETLETNLQKQFKKLIKPGWRIKKN